MQFLRNMIILWYKGQNQTLQINSRSKLSNKKFVDVFIQLHLLQKSRNIKINGLRFIFIISGSLESSNLRVWNSFRGMNLSSVVKFLERCTDRESLFREKLLSHKLLMHAVGRVLLLNFLWKYEKRPIYGENKREGKNNEKRDCCPPS